MLQTLHIFVFLALSDITTLKALHLPCHHCHKEAHCSSGYYRKIGIVEVSQVLCHVTL